MNTTGTRSSESATGATLLELIDWRKSRRTYQGFLTGNYRIISYNLP